MSMTTQAVVNVKALQKSLNQMSRDERIEFIRASGDPQDRGAHRRPRRRPARRAAAAVAGRREPAQGAHQVVRLPHLVGGRQPRRPEDARRLRRRWAKRRSRGCRRGSRPPGSSSPSTRSTSWTVKCIDRATGEEIYFNTTLPKGTGSWASEERGAEGDRREDRRRVLARLLPAARQRDRAQVALRGRRLPTPAPTTRSLRELVGLPAVITASRGPTASRASTTCRSPAAAPRAISSRPAS